MLMAAILARNPHFDKFCSQSGDEDRFRYPVSSPVEGRGGETQ